MDNFTWVIKREDGSYHSGGGEFTSCISMAHIYPARVFLKRALRTLKEHFPDVRAVKIKIIEVDEDENEDE